MGATDMKSKNGKNIREKKRSVLVQHTESTILSVGMTMWEVLDVSR
jgi:hypothetical protein